MSLPESTTVLIVGAGPAGLTAALSLIHHGCRDLVIVDAVLEGQNTSRAATIHAATVEALNSINAADDLLSRAVKVKSFRVASRTGSSQLIQTKFDTLKKHTAYPYVFLSPQNVTEFVLGQKLQRLGVQVQRPHKVVGMKQDGKDPRITNVSFEDGQVVRTRYIVGADGARSVVRSIAGIGFSDPDGSNMAIHSLSQMVMADVIFDHEPADVQALDGHLNGTFSSGGFFFVISFSTRFNEELARDGKPIKGSVYRVAGTVPVENGEPPHAPPKEYVQNLINTYGPTCISSDPSVNPTPVNIDQLVWSSRFRTHSAIVDRTFTRLGAAILLVGDAAHIHSPVGGQGMNLAIRDAVFLGDAVTKHIRASAENPDVDDTILREFAEARRARGLEIINYTKGLTRFAGLSYNTYWWMPFSLASIRDLGLWILGKFEFAQFMHAWGVSGLGRR